MRNPWLCITIVATLGLTLLVGVVGMVVLSAYGKTVPGELTATIGTCVGALSSFLVMPPRGSIGTGNGGVVFQEKTTVLTPRNGNT